MKGHWQAFLCAFELCLAVPAFATKGPDVTGRWEVTTTYPGGTSVAGLDLSVDHGQYQGRSGWLIPDWAVLRYTGALEKDVAHLKITYDGGMLGPTCMSDEMDFSPPAKVRRATGGCAVLPLTPQGFEDDVRSSSCAREYLRSRIRCSESADPPTLQLPRSGC